MILDELAPGSFFTLNKNGQVRYCKTLGKTIGRLVPENISFRDFFKSPVYPIILEELSKNVFFGKIFENVNFSLFIRNSWFDFVSPLGLHNNKFLGRDLKELFTRCFAMRSRILRETSDFRRAHPEFPLRVIGQFWIDMGKNWNRDELLAMMNCLVDYPLLWDPKIVEEMIWQIYPRGKDFTFSPLTESKFFNKSVMRYLDAKTISDAENSDHMKQLITVHNFMAKDNVILQKFMKADFPGQGLIFLSGLHRLVQVGVYLQSIEDGISDLSIGTLCTIYGVGVK